MLRSIAGLLFCFRLHEPIEDLIGRIKDHEHSSTQDKRTDRTLERRVSLTFGECHGFVIQFGLLNEEVHEIAHIIRVDQFVRIRFCGQTTKELPSIVGLLRSHIELRRDATLIFGRGPSRTDWRR